MLAYLRVREGHLGAQPEVDESQFPFGCDQQVPRMGVGVKEASLQQLGQEAFYANL